MKTTFVIKVLQTDPVHIEGHIHVRAKNQARAMEKLAAYGDYTVLDVKEKE